VKENSKNLKDKRIEETKQINSSLSTYIHQEGIEMKIQSELYIPQDLINSLRRSGKSDFSKNNGY